MGKDIRVVVPEIQTNFPYRVVDQVDRTSHTVALFDMELTALRDPNSAFAQMSDEQRTALIRAAGVIADFVENRGGSVEDRVAAARLVITAADIEIEDNNGV